MISWVGDDVVKADKFTSLTRFVPGGGDFASSLFKFLVICYVIPRKPSLVQDHLSFRIHFDGNANADQVIGQDFGALRRKL